MEYENKKTERRGATLVEVLMYLGVAAFIIGGAIVLYNMAYKNYIANETIEEIETIISRIHDVYPDPASYQDISNGNTFLLDYLPKKWRGESNTVTTPSGGMIMMQPASMGAVPVVLLILNDVPVTTCFNIITKDFGSNVIDRMGGGFSKLNGPMATRYAYIFCEQNYTNTIGLYIR